LFLNIFCIPAGIRGYPRICKKIGEYPHNGYPTNMGTGTRRIFIQRVGYGGATTRTLPAPLTSLATLDEADAWLRECEKICRAIGCTDAQKLTFVTFLRVVNVEYWWVGMQQLMQTREEQVTWANIRTRFLEKYFPDNARYEREAKFLTLQQGTMMVQAYTNQFEYLATFYSHVVTEEWCCRKFEGGLNHELRRFLVPLRIWEFLVLVEQAKMVERLERDPSRVMRAHPNNSTINEKRQEKPYTRPQREGRGVVKCFECGGDHFRRVCPEFSGASRMRRSVTIVTSRVITRNLALKGGSLKCHDNNQVKFELIFFLLR